MLLLEDIKRIVASVTFPGYQFNATSLGDGLYTIEARFKAPCTVRGGEPVWQYTRRWLVDANATEGAVVGTCLKLVLTSIEHEARETFLWKGVRVFDPHTDIHALAHAQRPIGD